MIGYLPIISWLVVVRRSWYI